MIKNVYIHTPFCLKKCRYCDFAVHAIGTASPPTTPHILDLTTKYQHYLETEIAFWQKKLLINKKGFDTIYFGGGTPSIYSAEALHKVL